MCQKLLLPYEPSRTLRSSGSRLLVIPKVRTHTHGEASFQFYGPRLWNSLPEDLRAAENIQEDGYHFINVEKTWFEAQAFCKELYTDLATVTNQTEAETVCGSDPDCPVSEAWIGLHRPDTTRVWHWSQPAVEYQENEDVWDLVTYYQPGYAADEYRESCGYVWDNWWYDEDCNSLSYFVCYDSSTNTSILVRNNRRWLDALYFCRERYTDLIGGPQLAQAPPGRYWIGLFRDSWTWSDGSSSSFRNWESGLYNVLRDNWNPDTPQCATLSQQMRWKSEDCTEQRPFICYNSLDSFSINQSYHFININKPWSDAQTYCRDNYTDLATVRDQTEAERVCGSDSDCPVSEAWIGLHRPGTTRVWHWSQPALEYQENNDVWYRYTRKEPYYSSDNDRQSCGAVYNNMWRDWDCEASLFFVCYNNITKTSVVVSETKKWLEALHYCREHHTDLIAGPQLQQLPGGQYWIGLFRDSWTWSDGNNSSFRNWNVSEVSLNDDWSPSAPQCARLSEQNSWKSEDCNEQRPFICYGAEERRRRIFFSSHIGLTTRRGHRPYIYRQKIQERLDQSGLKVIWKTPPKKREEIKEQDNGYCPSHMV
ncbi:hypothetical protein WMY93_030670 [Mugilogobius chulae]|uniref:C-type lectin domain-containing protein n=1 Tax=Mugilogobius chulae TaxID=88201 RepID=A0AAW0MKR8_9GOBI